MDPFARLRRLASSARATADHYANEAFWAEQVSINANFAAESIELALEVISHDQAVAMVAQIEREYPEFVEN